MEAILNNSGIQFDSVQLKKEVTARKEKEAKEKEEKAYQTQVAIAKMDEVFFAKSGLQHDCLTMTQFLYDESKEMALLIHQFFFRLRVKKDRLGNYKGYATEITTDECGNPVMSYTVTNKEIAVLLQKSIRTVGRIVVAIAKSGIAYWVLDHFRNNSYKQSHYHIQPWGYFEILKRFVERVDTKLCEDIQGGRKVAYSELEKHVLKQINAYGSKTKFIQSLEFALIENLPKDYSVTPVKKDCEAQKHRNSFQHNVPEIKDVAPELGFQEQTGTQEIIELNNHISLSSKMQYQNIESELEKKYDEVAEESKKWMEDQIENHSFIETEAEKKALLRATEGLLESDRTENQPPINNSQNSISDASKKPVILDKHFGSFDTKEYRREMARQSVIKPKENKSRLTEEQETQFKVEYRDRILTNSPKTTRESANKSAEIAVSMERNSGTNLEVTDWLESKRIQSEADPFADAIADSSVLWDKLKRIRHQLGISFDQSQTVEGALIYKSAFPEDWTKTTEEIRQSMYKNLR